MNTTAEVYLWGTRIGIIHQDIEKLYASFEYLHCAGYPTEQALVIFHKHRFQHPYHQHGRANTLRQEIKSIQGHDKFQMNGRK